MENKIYYYSRAIEYYNQHKESNKIFNKIKYFLNEDDDLTEVNGFYFSKRAFNLLNKNDLGFFINQYYNLTISNILNMIDDTNNIIEVIENLFDDYKPYYAWAWSENFIDDLMNIEKRI